MNLKSNFLYFSLSVLFFTSPDGEAAPLPSQPTRTSPTDLEVYSLQLDGSPGPSRFYTYQQICSLPQVTATTKDDPNTHQSATYTGVDMTVLFAALGADEKSDVLGLLCSDHYKQYYDASYDAAHHPIFMTKYNGKGPADWPKSEHNTPMGPYCVVQGGDFTPAETVDSYVEKPRVPFGIISVEVSSQALSYGRFAPPDGASPEALNGYKIALGSCISCHNMDSAGGSMSGKTWSVVGAYATTNKDFFNGYVLNPQKYDPGVHMPAFTWFDEKTLSDLRAYFKSLSN